MNHDPAAASPAAENVNPEPTDEAAVAAAAEATDANAAESSPADETGANEPANLLDVVKSAVQPEAEAAASPTAGTEGAEAEAEADPAKAEEAEGKADADLPFHNHPRWKEVIAERDQYRAGAEQFGKITEFMDNAGLGAEEVAEGFDIMAKLKSGDPEQLADALEWLEPRVVGLRQQLGRTLPDDLQARVDNGELDDEAANELAQVRASEALLRAQNERREADESRTNAAVEASRSAQVVAQAVNGWEATVKATDPDYSKKAALVETACLAIVQRTGKKPVTADEAVALAKEAYAQVNEQFSAHLPKAKPIASAPRSSSAPTVAQPKTLRDAISAAVSG